MNFRVVNFFYLNFPLVMVGMQVGAMMTITLIEAKWIVLPRDNFCKCCKFPAFVMLILNYCSDEEESLKDIMTRIERMTIKRPKNIINVMRQNVQEGALRAFGRNTFQPRRRPDVRFEEEYGIDTGGPTREFFRLLIRQIRDSLIFEGPEHCKSLTLSAQCK